MFTDLYIEKNAYLIRNLFVIYGVVNISHFRTSNLTFHTVKCSMKTKKVKFKSFEENNFLYCY